MTGSAKQSIGLRKERMDCFAAEFIIGPAEGGTRWLLAMTEGARLWIVVSAVMAPPPAGPLIHRPDGLGDGGLRREDGDELATDILQQHRIGVVVLAHLVELHPLPGHDRLL